MLKCKNKNAQIGTTMTWVAATIVILVILTVFIYAVSLIANMKKIVSADINILDEKTYDIALAESKSAYLLKNGNADGFDEFYKNYLEVKNEP